MIGRLLVAQCKHNVKQTPFRDRVAGQGGTRQRVGRRVGRSG